jgi:hypothetical protein
MQAFHLANLLIITAVPEPNSMPISPPIQHIKTDSRINWNKIPVLFAPTAFLNLSLLFFHKQK